MAKEPYNIEFCRFVECEMLNKKDKCKKIKKCPHNTKWIEYWARYGRYPPMEGA